MKELKPFGDVPDKLSVQIKRSFVATRTYEQALATASEVAKNLISLRPSAECVAALTRMQQCGVCSGYAEKPCSNYCVNVMKGCLHYYAELDAEWDNFVASMEKLSERLLGPFNIVMVVEPINIKISEAIMNFQVMEKLGFSKHSSVNIFLDLISRTPATRSPSKCSKAAVNHSSAAVVHSDAVDRSIPSSRTPLPLKTLTISDSRTTSTMPRALPALPIRAIVSSNSSRSSSVATTRIRPKRPEQTRAAAAVPPVDARRTTNRKTASRVTKTLRRTRHARTTKSHVSFNRSYAKTRIL